MSTADVAKWENHLVAVMSGSRFRNKEGLIGEDPYFIYPYDPRDALEIAASKKRIKTKLAQKGIEVLEVNLYDLVVEVLQERGVWDDLIELEPTISKDDFREGLRSMLDRGTLLTVAQAARVGRDVASALEYAHARDVLHRDVKPANLLFDEHGVVRVADFGLARALAEASWTEPAGGMLGTARYASPEQASGLQLDARSDLYSLALVLVEAVTGRVPFAADTTIGMLTARTQRPLVAPQELPVGVLTAVLGGSYLLWLMHRRGRGRGR